MLYVRFAIVAVIVGVAAWFLFDAARLYLQTPGSVWDRALAAGKGSATILLQRFVALVTAIASALAFMATNYLDDPSLATAIQSALKPEYVGGAMLAIALLTIWARKRTL